VYDILHSDRWEEIGSVQCLFGSVLVLFSVGDVRGVGERILV
jgi:hypothetical protein